MSLKKLWLSLVIAGIFFFLFPLSVLACTCLDYGVDSHIPFPSTIVISPNAVTGTLLTDFVASEGTLHWQCQYTSIYANIALAFNRGAQFHHASQMINVDGKNFLAFPTKIKGIAVILRIRNKSAIYNQYGQDQIIPIQSNQQLLNHIHGAPVSEYPHYVAPVHTDMMIDRIEAALVKSDMSLIHSGTLSGEVLGEIGVSYSSGNTLGPLTQSHSIYYHSVHVVAPTCLTSDVYVPLPKQNIQQFQGSRMVAGSWVPFSIPVRQCPVGMRQLKFRLLRPRFGFLDESQQIIRPNDRMNGAKGIGLQLSDQRYQLIPYGQELVVPNYDRQSNFDIPLFVRYAKPTGYKATPGNVEASVLFELNYD